MNPKKDEYMRGYSDGFKDGMAAQQASLAAETIDLNARLGMSEGLKADARARAEMVGPEPRWSQSCWKRSRPWF